MAELFESSGLLSLASLREHEKKRAQEQVEAARARAEAEQRVRLEADREAAWREQERQRDERTARELAESARSAEQLRLETACASALSRSAEELRLNLSLERAARRTVELGLTAQLLRQRLLTSLTSALCVASSLGAFALYVGALRPAAGRALGAAQQALLAEQRAHGEAEARVLRGARRLDELSAHIESLEQRLREASAARPSPLPAQQPIAQKPGARPAAVIDPAKPCRDDGDPLNPCLRH